MSDLRVKLKYCNNEADDWTKVEDKVQRKKLQDRLAKRKSRKETSKHTKTTKANLTNETLSKEQTHSFGVAFGQSPDGLSENLTACSPNTKQLLVEDSPANLTSAPRTSEPPDQAAIHDVLDSVDRQCRAFFATSGLAEHRFILLTQYSLLRAFVQNANLLALDPKLLANDNALSPWTLSNPYPSNGPHTLSPTALQLSTDHHPYLDLLAPPSLRDSILLASLDDEQEEEICNDIHCGSFTVWGSQPWNSFGWEVCQSFATKWAWLLDTTTVQYSNFWRAERGELPLLLPI